MGDGASEALSFQNLTINLHIVHPCIGASHHIPEAGTHVIQSYGEIDFFVLIAELGYSRILLRNA